jgi:type IV secretory pathway TrbD component
MMALRGRIIPPEGYLYKAVSFDIAIGIYILTIILFVPLAGFSARGRRLWRWSSVALVLYAYAIENIQIYRGLDPRFSRAGSAADNIAGTLFGGVALGLIITFLILVRRFFSRRNPLNGSPLLLAIRYGCAAVLLAFFTGIWMGAINGAKIGATGNLLPLHAAGFHGLQAVPLVALLFDWSHVPAKEAKAWVHAAGLAWLGACAGIAWQTALGRSVTEGSTPTYIALAMLLAWLISALFAASIGLRRDASVRYPA